MKTNQPLIKPLLALAGMVLLAPIAQAALPYSNGDFILGFRTTGASNPDGLTAPAGTDYEINIGNAINFINGTPGPIPNIAADLTAIFGSNWYTRTDLFWSISGVTQPGLTGTVVTASNTLFATRPEDMLGTQSIPWTRLSSFASGAPANKMVSMASSGLGGYSVGTSATYNQLESTDLIGGLIQNSGGPNSYASFQPGGANTVGASAFGVFSGGIEGLPTSALDMYELQPGSGNGAFLGSFQISSGGDVSFNAGAAPEPSSLAILAAGAGLLGMLRRRRATRA
jgi:hypothetical protein